MLSPVPQRSFGRRRLRRVRPVSEGRHCEGVKAAAADRDIRRGDSIADESAAYRNRVTLAELVVLPRQGVFVPRRIARGKDGSLSTRSSRSSSSTLARAVHPSSAASDNGLMLLVISGLPGTGKTAVAAQVARDAKAVHLSIDTVEDALLGAGFPRSWTTGVAAYEAVRAAAEQNLDLGRIVVVDAVNDSEPARDTWRRAAETAGAPLMFVLLTLDDEVEQRRRLEGRSRNLANVLEPSWDDVRRRRASFEPWGDVHLRVNASESMQHIASVVLSRLSGPPTSTAESDGGKPTPASRPARGR